MFFTTQNSRREKMIYLLRRILGSRSPKCICDARCCFSGEFRHPQKGNKREWPSCPRVISLSHSPKYCLVCYERTWWSNISGKWLSKKKRRSFLVTFITSAPPPNSLKASGSVRLSLLLFISTLPSIIIALSFFI